jgi:hypothetical protein
LCDCLGINLIIGRGLAHLEKISLGKQVNQVPQGILLGVRVYQDLMTNLINQVLEQFTHTHQIVGFTKESLCHNLRLKVLHPTQSLVCTAPVVVGVELGEDKNFAYVELNIKIVIQSGPEASDVPATNVKIVCLAVVNDVSNALEVVCCDAVFIESFQISPVNKGIPTTFHFRQGHGC